MVSIVNILSGALHLMLDVRQTGIIPEPWEKNATTYFFWRATEAIAS
jgi:hypothetical protein